MRDIKNSGNIESKRKAILYGGLKTHQKILEKVKAGLRPYYRPQSFQKESRMSEKLCQKNNWFKKHDSSTQYAAVMFVDATPNDELLKLFRHIENTHKISDQHRIKFVSKSGVKLSNVVKKKNPFQMNCKDDECKPAVEAKSNGKVI